MTSVPKNDNLNRGPYACPVKSTELLVTQRAEIGVLKNKLMRLENVEKELDEESKLLHVINEEKENLQRMFQQAVIEITQTAEANEVLERELESHVKELDECNAKFADELKVLQQIHSVDKQSFEDSITLSRQKEISQLEEERIKHVITLKEMNMQQMHYNLLGDVIIKKKEKLGHLDLLRKRIFCEREACLIGKDATKNVCLQMVESMINKFLNGCEMLETCQKTVDETDRHIEHLYSTYDQICKMYESLQSVIRQQKKEMSFYENKIRENEKAIQKLETSKTSIDSNKQKLQLQITKLSEQLQLKIAKCNDDEELIKKLKNENERQKQELTAQLTNMAEQIQQQTEEYNKKTLDIEKIRKREKLLVEKNGKWKEEALQAQSNRQKMKEMLRICQNECERIKQEKDKLLGDIRNKNVLIRALDEQTKPSIDTAITELSRTEAILNQQNSSVNGDYNHSDDVQIQKDVDNRRKYLKRSHHEMEEDTQQLKKLFLSLCYPGMLLSRTIAKLRSPPLE